MALELPKIIDIDRLVDALNDRLRRIERALGIAKKLEFDMDGNGQRIVNVGAPREAADVLTLGVADLRYQPKGQYQKVVENKITQVVNQPAEPQVWQHTLILLDMTVGSDILSHRPRISLPGNKRFVIHSVQATTKGTAASTVEVNVYRRRRNITGAGPAFTMTAWASLFSTNPTIATGESTGDTAVLAIAELFEDDEIKADVVSNGGVSDCTITFRGVLD